MPKQWWSSRSMFVAQAVCLLALFAWSVRHAPGGGATAGEGTPGSSKESAPEAVIDNSEDTAAAEGPGEVDARFEAPPTVRFRTENPPAGTLNLRPVETPRRAEPWQPVHPQNPPRRLPGGPNSPFELSGKGATVYNEPPPDAD